MAREVGSLSEAERLPREIRQWWASEMMKEQQELADIRAGVKKVDV